MKRPLILIAALTGTLALAGCNDDGEVAQAGAQAEQSAATETSAQQATRTLEGVLEFDGDGQALPGDAEIIVSLQDVALADAPATIIAEKAITLEGSEPTDFRLDYPADAVTPSHAHALRATIRGAEDELLWTTTERHAVEVGPDAEQGPLTLVLVPVTGTPLAGEQESLQEAQESLLRGDDQATTDDAGDATGSMEAVSERATDMQEPSDPPAGDDAAADDAVADDAEADDDTQ